VTAPSDREAPQNTAYRQALPWAIAALGLLAFVLSRVFHPIQGLGNPDIAGILYSADVLRDGGLPYRDTWDMKSPGTFFVVAAIFQLFGRSLQALAGGYAVWIAVGAPALFLSARELYGERGVIAGAIASALYLSVMGMFDMNYASWMTPPYAWSFALTLVGLHRGARSAHALAGFAAAWAVLLKPHAGTVVLAVAATWWWARRREWRGTRPAMIGWWIFGAALGVLPLVVLYAAHGALPDLVRGVVPATAAAEYLRSRSTSSVLAWAIKEVPLQHIRAFFLPGYLACMAVAAIWLLRQRPVRSSALAPPVFFLAASLLGYALGFRFYVHYLPQCLPAWALLGAHPAAWDWFGARRGARAPLVRAVSWGHALLTAGLVVLILVRIPSGYGRHRYFDNPGSPAVERVGAFIQERTAPEDPILVWGWRGWGVYYFADRRSPSPLFKLMGEVTDPNANLAFLGGTEIHFRDGPLARRLLADVRARPPRYFVRSTPFFPGVEQDPLEEWSEMQRIVADEYEVVLRDDFLTVYERKAAVKP
jgi:hypothetical protein